MTQTRAEEVTVDAGPADRLAAISGATWSMWDYRIENGSHTNGGQFHVSNNAYLFLQSTDLVDGTASHNGGSIYISNATVHTDGSSRILDARAASGGCVYVAGSTGDFTMRDTSVLEGCATTPVTGLGNGGAVYVAHDATFAMKDASVVCNNAATGDGGAAWVQAQGSASMEDNSKVMLNSAEGDGGGFYSEGTLTLSGSYAIGTYGGPLASGACDAFGFDKGNEARSGGGVYLSGTGASLAATGGSIAHNDALVGGGGGIDMDDGGGVQSVTLDGVDISGNNAASDGGGGIYCEDGTLSVQAGSSVDGNTLTDGNGGGIRASVGCVLTVDASEVRDNTASAGNGGGIHASADVVVQNASTIAGKHRGRGQAGCGSREGPTRRSCSRRLSTTKPPPRPMAGAARGIECVWAGPCSTLTSCESDWGTAGTDDNTYGTPAQNGDDIALMLAPPHDVDGTTPVYLDCTASDRVHDRHHLSVARARRKASRTDRNGCGQP